MGELGYGFAYRILDAQYFGVAQRRRRVFVVGYLGDWRRAAAVLFERHSLSGHPAPSREKGQKVTSFTPSSIGGYSEGVGTLRAHGGDLGGGSENLVAARMVAFGEYAVDGTASAIKARDYKDATDLVAQPIPFDTTQITSPQNGNNPKSGDPCHPLAAGAHPPAIAQTLQAKNPMAVAHSVVAPTLTAANDPSRSPQSSEVTQQVYSVYQSSMAVRRLTPVECERLQGFGDNYTDIQLKGKSTPDGPRYKALGNSMAVPVMRWIGERIKQYEEMA